MALWPLQNGKHTIPPLPTSKVLSTHPSKLELQNTAMNK